MSKKDRGRHEIVINQRDVAGRGPKDCTPPSWTLLIGRRRRLWPIDSYIVSDLVCSRRVVLSLALLFAAALAGCSSSNPTQSTGGSDITTVGVGGSQLLTPAEFAATIADDGVTVVNVHIPYEGHIAGTDAFVPFDTIGTWSDLPDDRTTPIALYCRSGTMSATAAESLLELGYTNVVDLAGGMNAWIAAGQQLERS
jgi:rhodanese-related sulfurtransferase